MDGKRVIIGQSEWGIDDANFDDVTTRITEAMEKGTVVELPLLDSADRPVKVYLNGTVTSFVAVDPDTEPKPTEISG